MKSLFYCFAILVAVAYAENLSSEHRITVKDKDGNIFTSYSAQKYSAEKRFTCSLEGTSSAKWSISPEVEGIVMRENGGLIIDASQIRPKRTYTITATMTEGNTTLPFDIEIYGCEYGDFLVINTSVENTRMELYNGEEMVYNNSLPSTLNLCVPVATYRYILFYPLYGGMYVTINDEHGVRYHTVHMQVPDTLEGSFSNDPKTKPSISFPQVIYVAKQDSKRIPLVSHGPVDKVVIEPRVKFEFDSFTFLVYSVKEATTYTITAFHGDESVKTTFTVYSDACPEGYSLIDVILMGPCVKSAFTLPDVEPGAYYFGTKSFCLSEKPFNATVSTSDSCAMQFLKDGLVFFEHAPTHSSVTVTVRRHEPVTFVSQLAFSTDAPKSKWETVGFDDSAWKKGTEGGWGVFTSASAWFRAPFTMEKGYSSCRLFVRGEGSARIFVNGNAFSRATLTETGVIIVIPPAYLAENNVVAVALAKGASSTIRFGLSVMLTNTPLAEVMDGEASAIQDHPDPAHPAEHAFFRGNNYNRYWVTDTVPAELIFTFHNDTQQVVNAIQIACETAAPSFAFDVVGVTGEERVTLASFNRDSIQRESYSTALSLLPFSNLRAFASYHFVFKAANLTQPLKIFSVFLYTRPLFACPKKYGFKGVVDGTTLYKRCPLGYTGRKQLSCVHKNDETFWTESREQCYPTNPVKDYEFMDWTFTIRGITREAWKEGRPMTEMLAEETPMAGRDISYLYEDYAVDGEATVLTVHSRCLLDRGLSAVVKRKLKKLEPRFNELVSKWMGVECTASIGKVIIRHHVNWALVITVSVVSVVVITLVAVYLSFRHKKGAVKHLQKGINPNGDDKASLLV